MTESWQSYLFNIFHDGVIDSYTVRDQDVELVIDIIYLAEKIHPHYHCFKVHLHNCTYLRFSSWQDNSVVEDNIEQVLQSVLDMEISNAEFLHQAVHVNCLDNERVGGTLTFQCENVTIYDQANSIVPFPILQKLCIDYWHQASQPKY